jgi:hypothetical protein
LQGSSIVRKRCVLVLGGYEPVPAERQHYRFKRELQRFERTWNVTSIAADMTLSPDGVVASWPVETRGPNWQVATDYVLLRWDDMVAADFGRPGWARVPLGIAALADFIVSGTAYRYFATSWRYGIFFIYPIVLLAAFAALSIFAAYVWTRFELPFASVLAPVVAIVVFAGLIRWPGRPMHLAYIFDNWISSTALTRWNRAGLDARVDRFASELVARMKNENYDEVVFAGQSLGAAIQPEVVDRALRLDPDLGRMRPLNLLSTGSSLLKVGLHPAAQWLRAAVERISRQAAIFWVEYQARADIINFFRVDPIAAMGLPPTGKPIVQNARIREMLEKETYRRFELDFLRMHRQLGMGNERRYFYDFFMICCGPVPLEARARFPERMVAAFAADGRYLDAAAAEESAAAARGNA